MRALLSVRPSSVRIFLAFATAVVVLGAILIAAAPTRAAGGQNGERPPSSIHRLAGLAPQGEVPPSWTAAPAYPTGIARYAFAQNGEDMYVISGVIGLGNVVNTVRRYNAATNVWTSLANIPVGSQGAAGAYYNGKIYVATGAAGNGFQIYDIATNTWSAGPPRPGVFDSFGAAAGAYNGNVFVVGGSSAGPSSVVSVYNIASNTWNPVIAARYRAQLHGSIYNIASNTSIAGPGPPSPYQLGGYAQIGQFLYLIGSYTNNPAVNSSVSMRLDMSTSSWSTGPAWTPQRADFALAVVGTRLFAIGGDSNGGSCCEASAQVNELETSTWPAGAWIPSPDNLPSARQGNQAGFFSTGRAGGEIWSTGGVAAGTYLNEHIFRLVPVPCQEYNITESTRPLVPATTDIGNHCNNCVTGIPFPFPVSFYGTTYTGATGANISSNGNVQFTGANSSGANTNLPAANFNATIFAFWDDLLTNTTGAGIFTSVTGAFPHRVFTIEWRVSNFSGSATSNFEIRFLEGSPDFEIIYGATTGTLFGTIGVQRDSTSLFTQFAGPSATVPAEGTRLLFTTGCCAPIAFNGAIGSNSDTYPGSSGVQTGRLVRNGVQSVCGTAKAFPGIVDAIARTYDQYSFTNNGPATCVTFSVNTACTVAAAQIFPAAYLGSFNPANIATNYLGDPGLSPGPFESFSVDVPANATVVLVVNEVVAGGACPSYDVVVTGLSCPLELTTAVSRKTHGAAGEFDIPLPLTGQPGVECRTGQPASGNHKLVFTFNSRVTSGNAAVTLGIGSAGTPSFLGKTMTVPLSGVTDIQKITLTLSGVTSSLGQVLPNTAVSMNLLLGDTTGSKTVNSTDVSQTKAQSGSATTLANFRSDTSISGSVNATDVSQVKVNSGHGVP